MDDLMQQDEIIRLAREAGIPIETDWAGRPATLVIKDGGTYLRGVDDLRRFAQLVAKKAVEAEREYISDILGAYPIENKILELIRDAINDRPLD